MIDRSLGCSRKFAALIQAAGPLGEFAQALYPLVVAHADDYGREAGDAFTVKHAVLSTSSRTEAEFDAALQAMQTVGLVRRYDAEDQTVLEVMAFDAHQDLHKRAQKSRFPEFTGKLRNSPDCPPQLKRTEEKRTEEKYVPTVAAKSTPQRATAPPDPRVKAFLAWFQAEYKTRRHGATYFVPWKKDAPLVKRLLTTYEPERLQKHAKILLTTDDAWVDRTDRGIGILAAKINWLEERLATWEATQRRTPTAAIDEHAAYAAARAK
uniref:Uncharacterized protein n=1 Tax=viral metagenome TaxID=1070528 RepID=A0A6M3JH81_9ZZZZ